MSYAPQSQEWRSDRALLLVHGVGNAAPGDYRILHERIREILGDSAKDFAIYQLYYDSINDWFTEKTELRERIDSMLGIVSEGVPRGTIGDLLSEFIGDVLWPVLSQAARTAVREAYLAQLKQIVLDGIASGHRPKRQKLSIVCHSLGCFHTYEALHAAASDPSHGLQPATHGVRFKNVVYMASPVQLIRSVASRISGLVPSHRMATLDPEGLRLPGEDALGMRIESVDNWISITGSLDPIGGFFLRRKAQWAYMAVTGQLSIVDPQDGLVHDDEELRVVFAKSLENQERPPEVEDKNPHSWVGYVVRHAPSLKAWMTA
ncbi:MAG: hypothetical protein H6682_21420 [Candidatus Eisenbacteria bacterium]|nr:hypothetical protein [Candidatus Eisenbacteria bacterium]